MINFRLRNHACVLSEPVWCGPEIDCLENKRRKTISLEWHKLNKQ
jgi:hypothetical protein